MIDPFDVLGVDARFDLDPGVVQRAYLARAARLHPDLGQGDVGGVGGEDDSASAALNEAKRVLDDPEARANALLARLGGPSKEADRSLPAGFLGEMMAVREEAEAAKDARDREALARWRAWAGARRDEHRARVGELFAGLGPRATPEALRGVRTELNAWRYVERMIEQLALDYDPMG